MEGERKMMATKMRILYITCGKTLKGKNLKWRGWRNRRVLAQNSDCNRWWVMWREWV